MTKYKYLIFSDVHLGSKVTQSEKLIQVLKTVAAETIIINGDLIDINHTNRLNKKDWEILSILRKLSKSSRVIYISGNHDDKIYEMISELLGFEHFKNFQFTINKKLYHITHGDIFDSFISKYNLITEIATTIYYIIQRFSTKKQILARAIKRRSKNFIKCCEKIRNRALTYIKSNNINCIILGHTHHKELSKNKEYVNCGCFTETECSYVTIDENGDLLLNSI